MSAAKRPSSPKAPGRQYSAWQQRTEHLRSVREGDDEMMMILKDDEMMKMIWHTGKATAARKLDPYIVRFELPAVNPGWCPRSHQDLLH
jgi:hypothetical protein